MSPPSVSAASQEAPGYMSAFDSDWTYYVRGHDTDDLHVIDDPEALDHEKLWMRPIRASQCEDYGLCDDDPDDRVLRDSKTGRFVARIVWIECAESHPKAVPYMGCRYTPEALA